MRVDPKPSSTTLAATAPLLRREGAAGGRRFALDGSGQAGRPAAPSAAPLATVDALLALQGESDPGERRRRSALRRGHDLLDALDGLKAALLGGRVAPADLQGLQGRIAQARETSGDGGLDEVLAHIELRAQVELAKLSRG